ncbi:hypothetical protein GCM10010431_06110 [Streptomyces kunmingensis]
MGARFQKPFPVWGTFSEERQLTGHVWDFVAVECVLHRAELGPAAGAGAGDQLARGAGSRRVVAGEAAADDGDVAPAFGTGATAGR